MTSVVSEESKADERPLHGAVSRPQKYRSKIRNPRMNFFQCTLIFAILHLSVMNLSTFRCGVDINNRSMSHSIIKRPICTRTRHLFRIVNLTSAYLQAEKFHYGGGNMKVIGSYLNDQIDISYDMFDIRFKPKGSDEFLKKEDSVSDTIIKTLRANDRHKRGGYDQRQYPGQFENRNKKYFNDHNRGRIDVIEPYHTARWDAGLGPKFEVCKSVDRIGGEKESYEDKFMCSFHDLMNNKVNNYINDNANANSDNCEMISIGSNGQWGFEESIVKNTNCSTHTFDCTVNNPKKPNIDSIHFYPYCVSATNKMVEGREYMTYSKIVQKAGIVKSPTLFKMDVEGFEFDVLAQMLNEALESGTTHLLPSQISVELHFATRMFDVPWMLRYLQASEISMFMAMMYSKGYVPVHVKYFGPACHSCAEVLFVRLFCE